MIPPADALPPGGLHWHAPLVLWSPALCWLVLALLAPILPGPWSRRVAWWICYALTVVLFALMLRPTGALTAFDEAMLSGLARSSPAIILAMVWLGLVGPWLMSRMAAPTVRAQVPNHHVWCWALGCAGLCVLPSMVVPLGLWALEAIQERAPMATPGAGARDEAAAKRRRLHAWVRRLLPVLPLVGWLTGAAIPVVVLCSLLAWGGWIMLAAGPVRWVVLSCGVLVIADIAVGGL